MFPARRAYLVSLSPNAVARPPRCTCVCVTIEYVTSEVRVIMVHKSLLATMLKELYAAESET